MNKAFDLIVFDWDGTLMDSTAHITLSIQQACADLNLPTPSQEQARHVIGLRLTEALQQACPDANPLQLPRLIEAFGRHYAANQHKIVLFKGVAQCLYAIRASNTLIAVATGNSRNGLNHLLEQTGLTPLFSATRTVDECPSKPHPAMLMTLSNALGVAPSRTLMVGDTSHDLQMAINAGCPSIGVSYGAHASQYLETYQPLAIFHSFASLHKWLLPQLG